MKTPRPAIKIGQHQLDGHVILAPMAGITDQPFRDLCVTHGASLAVSEMLTCNSALWESRKNRTRYIHSDIGALNSIQIAGSDPEMMADAARMHADLGADIIDINMGCPAKKVLKKAAGSALLKDKELVTQILKEVVNAVDIPVTLKIRTGWSPESRNGVEIAKIAENEGIQLLTVHGRTRECRFVGDVEYDTIKDIKDALSIPVIANGDITTPERAKQVMHYTGADGVMIGRGAYGNPWIFSQIKHYLETGDTLPGHTLIDLHSTLLSHVQNLHELYGEIKGVLFARKHVAWYTDPLDGARAFRAGFNALKTAEEQVCALNIFFDKLISTRETCDEHF